jgi:hypothetical protein
MFQNRPASGRVKYTLACKSPRGQGDSEKFLSGLTLSFQVVSIAKRLIL